MLQINISRVIEGIVRQELRNQGRKNEALYLNFDLRMSHHIKGKTFNQSRGLHLLYHSPNGSYISVFSGITNSPFGNRDEALSWKHECHHDICWRDINVFSNIYFEMAEQINNNLQKKIAPKDMQEHHSFRNPDFLFQFIPVEVSMDKTDEFNYRRLIKLL